MNPYDPPEMQSQRAASHRLHWFAFASTATVAFGVASWISHCLHAGPQPFIATPTQFVVSYLTFFAFSGMIGAVNLFSPMHGYVLRSPIAIRIATGVIFGMVPIPLNFIIVDYLWYLRAFVSSKVAEIVIVVVVPVMLCTAVERLLLKFVTFNDPVSAST
jgi:hypothetical protein